jgi:drug/metabolite transporter (DMT)-like permease
MPAALALISALMWGTADFLGGLTARRRSALAIYLGSQIFGFAFLLTVVLVRGDWHAPLGYLWWGIGLGFTGLISMVAFYRALALGPMGLVYTGVAALGFGLLYVGMAKGSETSPSMTMLTYRGTSMVILVAVLIVARNAGGLTKSDLPVLAAIGIMDAAANLLFGIASTLGMLSTTSVLSSLYPIATAVLAAVVLRERLRPIQYAGVTVAMIGVILLSTGGR